MKQNQNRQIDLKSIPVAEYLLSIGEPLVKISNFYYQHKEHDSLKVNTKHNYFVWNSRRAEKNSYGGVAQYLMIMYELTFVEALKKITADFNNTNFELVKIPEKKYPKNFYYRVKESHKSLQLKRYLMAKRKISARVVDLFMKQDLIAMNNKDEIIFKWYRDSKIVGFSKQGTQKLTEEEKNKYHYKRDYLKYVAPTTKKDTYWGFNFLVGKPLNLYFFEGGVDLMSFLSLYYEDLMNKGDFWLIFTDGVVGEKIYSFIAAANQMLNDSDYDIESLHCCYDNDKTGSEMLAFLQTRQYSRKDQKKVQWTDNIPPLRREEETADWNSEIVYQSEIAGKGGKNEKSD